MRITTTTIDDFIANLEDANVFRNVVYYERSSRPLNGKTKRDATSFDVFYQTSAVLDFTDGQALLVCGVNCGTDRHTSDGELEGTEESNRLHEQLKSCCESKGLRLLPGVLDQ